MEWYQGSITDAISHAKSSDRLLSILVFGEDSQSEQVLSSLASELLAPTAHRLVSLKLKQPSAELTQFAQIYPVLCVPSLYLIESRNGIALEVLAGAQQAESLSEKIQSVLDSRSARPTDTPQPSGDPPPMAEPAAKPDPAQERPASQMEVVEEPANVNVVDEPAQVTQQAESEATLQEKKERAEKLLEIVRQDKEKKIRDDERRKEIERREALKNLQRLKREQEDKEIQQYAMQQQKEKDEDKKYREQLQEQIRKERLERTDKYNAEKAVEEERRRKILQEKQEEAERIKAQKSASANIMYRMPDGSSVTHVFDSNAPFIEVRQYIADLKQLGDFNLAMNFPKRVFDSSCNSQTLKDLQLAPSAMIYVISKTATTNDAPVVAGWWGMMMAPFNLILSFFASFIAAVLPSQTAITPMPAGQPAGRNAPGPSRTRKADVKKVPYQRSGNVHRLNTSDESDNENNTWNGNSTQQM